MKTQFRYLIILVLSIFILPMLAHATCGRYIPNTSIGVGQGCLPSADIPTLNNPQDPVNYGADDTGANDSASAVQAALAVGDVYFQTPGTYKIDGHCDNGGTVNPPAGSVIECGPNVILENSCNNNNTTAIFFILEPNVTVYHCQFTDTHGPNTGFTNNSNRFIQVQDTTSAIIEASSFRNNISDSAILMATNNGDGGNNSIVRYNTFTNDRVYGASVAGGSGNTIEYNYSINSSLGDECNWEGSLSGSPCGNDTYAYNWLNGTIESSSSNPYFITGGTYVDSLPSSQNWSKYNNNLVENNYCNGGSYTHLNVGLDISQEPGLSNPPTYTNNTLAGNCTCSSQGGAQTCASLGY